MAEKSPRNFRVLHTQFSPWPKGHVFSETEFVRLYPAPEGEKDYHAGLLNHHLAAKAIEVVDPVREPEVKPELAPPGPENRPAATATRPPPK